MNYSRLFKRLRKDLYMNQVQLAEILGCTQAYVSAVECEIREPNLMTKKVVEYFCQLKKYPLRRPYKKKAGSE